MTTVAVQIDSLIPIYNILLGAILDETADAHYYFKLANTCLGMMSPEQVQILVSALQGRRNSDRFSVMNLMYNNLSRHMLSSLLMANI